MRTLAIGDIHGCNTALESLLKSVQPAPGDRFVLLGDYIDRGPSSCEVVETLLALDASHSPIFLRGNHEVMLLEARDDSFKADLWQNCSGLETLSSYNAKFQANWASSIPARHWEFFAQTKRFFETENHIFVHAGLDSGLDLSEQPDWMLYWETLDRLKPHKSGKRIVCGHTRQRTGEIKTNSFATCIDTGAAVGGWLTCLDVDSATFWQANEKGQTRTGKL